MASGLEPMPITPQKQDPAWKHCQLFKNGQRVQLRCLYCDKFIKGGGIHRMKEHLACHKGNGSTCPKVPPDVRTLMQQSLSGLRKKHKNNQEILDINPVSCELDMINNDCDASDELRSNGVIDSMLDKPNPGSSFVVKGNEGMSSKSADKRKRGRPKSSTLWLNRSTPKVGGAIDDDDGAVNNNIVLRSKRGNEGVDMAIGRFLFDIGAPLDAINSVYFQPMIEAIVSGGSGVVPPSYHDLRGWILKNSVEEVNSDVEKYRATWVRTGCSVLVDQWSTEAGRTLLNFIVYCPQGTVFMKSVDASNIVNSVDALYELLRQVVEEVGIMHVLQVITSSEEQYIVAGKRLSDTFPTLYWAPCAARCIDLMLEDFGKLEWIYAIIEQGRCITRFVYNHSVVLNMMRRHTFGNDIVEPGITRSSTNFTTLKRIVDLKCNLQAMVTSQEWMNCPYSTKAGGLAMLDIVSNQSFWSSCVLIIRLTYPLLRILSIVGSEKRPAMGYVYAGMYRAKEAIKKELVKGEEYLVYWNIIDRRWKQQWHPPLHAAGFYLNPKFFYSIEGDMHSEILSGMFDCIERLVPDIKVQDKIIKEINSYKNAVGDFGRKMAIRARDTLLPAEWWSTYGGGCPNLARLAIRILSQTCSSYGYKRNQIPFEQIHDTGNCLEHQRLSDLIFVQYNLHMREIKFPYRVGKSKQQDSVDPIAFDSISIVDDWVTEKYVCLEDHGSSDWMALDPPSAKTMLLGHSNDEAEDLGAGFNDHEIFNRAKEGEENFEDTKPLQWHP